MKLCWAVLLILGCALHVSAQHVVVKPYVQPDFSPGSLEKDQKILIWFTDQTPGDFTVEFNSAGEKRTAIKPERQPLYFAPAKPAKLRLSNREKPQPPPKLEISIDTNVVEEAVPFIPEKDQFYFKYTAVLTNLPLDAQIEYRVKLGETIVRESSFHTRATPGQSIRFVMVGDLANGKESQNAIAWQIAQQHPQFLVGLGDIVYSAGRMSQYMSYFWPTYNQPKSEGPATGAALMASVPFHIVLGNHDTEEGKWPDYPDALGAYFVFYPAGDGPGIGTWNTPLGKNNVAAAAFRRAVGKAYPNLACYSFENGPAHFLVLDSGTYSDMKNPALLRWIAMDLQNAKTRWKFVCFHVPAFQTTKEHYLEQKMRRLEPIFEKWGVDVVFSGHVHNYQRSKPLRFRPNLAYYPRAKNRVDGFFEVDEQFDGIKKTQPKGVIHIVSGGGGATLYKMNYAAMAETLTAEAPGNWVPYTAKFFSDSHSFTLVELEPNQLQLRQLNENGWELDRMLITKPANR
ncbi:MAG TPA: metallophosphoesterase [Verrucomicrobiae bacterium]|jgi:hypothetical protein